MPRTGGENLDGGCRIHAPDEQRHLEPAHAGCAQFVGGGDEVDAGEDGREAEDEGGKDHHRNAAASGGGIGRVEGPAGVDAAEQESGDSHGRADPVDVEGCQVEAGEGDVLGSEQQRQHEVAESRRDGGDDDEEHHDCAVEGEGAVVHFGRHDGGPGGEQLEPDQQGEQSADDHEGDDRPKVHQADALVVDGGEPVPEALVLGEVVRVAADGG